MLVIIGLRNGLVRQSISRTKADFYCFCKHECLIWVATFIIRVAAIFVITGPRNGFVPFGANPFPEPMMPTSHVVSKQECLIWPATFIVCIVAMLVLIGPRNGVWHVGAK